MIRILEKEGGPFMKKKKYGNPVMEVYYIFEKDILADSDQPDEMGTNESELIF